MDEQNARKLGRNRVILFDTCWILFVLGMIIAIITSNKYGLFIYHLGNASAFLLIIPVLIITIGLIIYAFKNANNVWGTILIIFTFGGISPFLGAVYYFSVLRGALKKGSVWQKK